MNFWPESSTLSEDGAGGAPAAGGSSSSGSSGSLFSQGGAQAMNAGEIMLSRAETAALAAIETEPDEAHGMRRARAESGLTEQQIKALQRRATHALSKGITLKGQGFIRKPTPGAPEEPSLVKRAVKGGGKGDEYADAMRANKKAVEALRNRMMPRDLYEAPVFDYKFPTPHSQGEPDDMDSVHLLASTGMARRGCAMDDEDTEETNAQSTMARLSAANRRQRRRRA